MTDGTLGVARHAIAWYRAATMRITTGEDGAGMGDHEGLR